MKYRNASEILPDELLRELQKYAPGEVLYVPRAELRQKWGEQSGARSYYTGRNEDIRREFTQSSRELPREQVIEELALKYHLSGGTIRKIVYRK